MQQMRRGSDEKSTNNARSFVLIINAELIPSVGRLTVLTFDEK